MEQKFKDWFSEVKSVALDNGYSENEVSHFMQKNWKKHYESDLSPKDAVFAHVKKIWDTLNEKRI